MDLSPHLYPPLPRTPPPGSGSYIPREKARAWAVLCPHPYALLPPRGQPYSQNSMTGEVKLAVLLETQRLRFFRKVSSRQWGVFQLWLHLAQGSSDWKDWNR